MPLDIVCSVTPRPYQEQALYAALDSLKEYRSTLVVSPTGTGKTIMFSLLAKLGHDRGRRILILVDRDELVKQAVRRLREDVGLHAQVEKAHLRADYDARVVVASIQTLSRKNRLERWAPDAFDLVVCDEGHHAVSPTWKRVLDYFKTAKIVGFTATPDRKDCKSLLRVFEDVAYEMSVREAIQGGWLTPIRQLFIKVPGLDLSGVNKAARDLNQGDLEAVVHSADILEHMAVHTIEAVEDRKTIVFCVTKAHAHAFAEFLQRRGCSAQAILDDTPPHERSEAVHRFCDGDLQFLANVGCLIEGFDAPATGAIVMARHTTSRGLYAQQVGRGTRPLPGTVDGISTSEGRRQAIAASEKSQLLVLDFVGNSGDHKLVHAAYAIDPTVNQHVAKKAEQLAQQQGLLIHVALEMAEKLVAEAKRRPVDGDQSMLEFQSEEVDPFDDTPPGRTLKLFDLQRIKDPWRRPITQPQIHALTRLGVKEAHLLNRNEASALLNRLIPRAKSKLATAAQVQALVKEGEGQDRCLQLSFEEAGRMLGKRSASEAQRGVLGRYGYDGEQLDAMNSSDASMAIDAIKQSGWQRPSGATP